MRLITALSASLVVSAIAVASTIPVAEDRSVFQPGSQPGSATLEPPSRCRNCHGDYDPIAEPSDNWRGSMMANAARDPLWLAAFASALQDSIWLTGNANGGDLCLRCHTPAGWLGRRSDPTNGTLLTADDREGVTCDSCHRMVDPFTTLGQPQVPPDDGATAAEAGRTRQADLSLLSSLELFDGSPFFDAVKGLPKFFGSGSLPAYVEAGGGQYIVSPSEEKRGPRTNRDPMHGWYYSRFHRSSQMCGSCHDVSNPLLANRLLGAGTAERQAAASYFPLERTFSEFMSSAYARGGTATRTVAGERTVARCQDCHMKRVRGTSSIMSVIVRDDLAQHDFTGGNSWILGMLASVDRGHASFDPYNEAILSGSKYPGAKIETVALQGRGDALAAGAARALDQLRAAAAIRLISRDDRTLRLRIQNYSGHKLISGFPEGRRMWLNVRFYDGSSRLLREINPYQPLVIRRDAAGNAEYVAGGDLVRTDEALVYEAKMRSSVTGESNTLHFLLATGPWKDNRIPPKGFDTAVAAERLSLPYRDGSPDPALFTSDEYAGGYDDVAIAMPAGAVGFRATLYYQTTSKEYVEFLRDEINGSGRTLAVPTPAGAAVAYIAQSDPFFVSLRDWGRAMWDLWLHNGGAQPVPIATLTSRRRPVTR